MNFMARESTIFLYARLHASFVENNHERINTRRGGCVRIYFLLCVLCCAGEEGLSTQGRRQLKLFIVCSPSLLSPSFWKKSNKKVQHKLQRR